MQLTQFESVTLFYPITNKSIKSVVEVNHWSPELNKTLNGMLKDLDGVFLKGKSCFNLETENLKQI